MEEVKLTIPGYLPNPTEGEQEKIEDMLFKFGNARRRAYNMIQEGIDKPEIERRLQRESGLNARYVRDAINSIKDLPSSVTFGERKIKNSGKRERSLRESTIVAETQS